MTGTDERASHFVSLLVMFERAHLFQHVDHMRIGQSIFNAASTTFDKNIVRQATGTNQDPHIVYGNFDPFYDDRKTLSFLVRLLDALEEEASNA